MQVRISLHGCDDTTVFTMEASEDELDFLHRIKAAAENASTYPCMPTMSVVIDNEGEG
jgi:hypothetical protein